MERTRINAEGKELFASLYAVENILKVYELRRTDKCRTDDDGTAEALLMALYAQRHF